MPSVNMIAARRAEKKRLEKLIYVTLMVIVGELAIVLAVMGFMTARVHADNSRIRGLDRDMARIQPTVDKIRKYELEIKELSPRLDLLSSSRDQTMLWHSVLQDLGRCMPEKTWLTSMATTVTAVSSSPPGGATSAAPATTLNLGGASVSQQLVGEAMLRLNQCPEFGKVDLTYTQDNPSSGSSAGTAGDAGTVNTQTLQFQISAELKSADAKKGGSSGS
jgi:Tfp pilus assembly protein PilN